MTLLLVKKVLCGLATCALVSSIGSALAAQDVSFEPILLDLAVSDDGVTQDDVLVIAYQPRGASPLIGAATIDRVAVRVPEGRPQPSIIIGTIDPGEEVAFGIDFVLPATVERFRFDYDDIEAREALRARNPNLFRRLVAGGYVDPPSTGNTLVRALQSEFSRMNCYTSTIDGLWGNGSRRAILSYFQLLSNVGPWPSDQPSNELFRAILINGDVECTVAAAAEPRATTTSRATTPARSTATPRTQATQPAPAATPTTPPRRSLSGSTGVGVFR